MKRVLVTGASGQLGRSINEISGNYPQLRFDFKNSNVFDITNSLKVNVTFANSQFDYCINCAAYTDVEQAEKNPEKAYSVNAQGVSNLARACLENNVTLLHISTDYVFDGEKNEPYTIDDKPNPINAYGASKLKGEEYVQDVLKRYYIIRTSWLYSEYGKNFYRTILRKANAEKKLQVNDEQTGCPTHARNLSTYILGLIDSKNESFGIHHFTDGEAMTWYDFAKRILAENGLVNEVLLEKMKNYRTFAKRPVYSVLG